MKRALLVLAACGGKSYTNQVETPRVTLADVHAPHVAVIVQTSSGLKRVWLDTGKSQDISGDPNATAIDGSTILRKEAGQYVIERGGARTIVDGVDAAKYELVSPDRKLIAFTEEQTIVTITVADAAVRRYPLAKSPTYGMIGFWWEPTSDALLISHNGSSRLDLATGAESPIDKINIDLTDEHPTLECAAGGFRLEKKIAKREQQIVLVPMASPKDPETLTSFDTKVLVRATDRTGHLGDGAINLGKKNPEPLQLELVLPSCEYFLFELEGKLYIGEVATGRIAYVTNGWAPVL